MNIGKMMDKDLQDLYNIAITLYEKRLDQIALKRHQLLQDMERREMVWFGRSNFPNDGFHDLKSCTCSYCLPLRIEFEKLNTYKLIFEKLQKKYNFIRRY